MSRGLSATNIAETAAANVYVIILVKLEFDTPLYVHSAVGTIAFEGNDYLGVGQFGTIESVEETEQITTSPIQLTLSGVDASLISEGLDAGNYGDIITIYEGYRGEDGLLVDDPWILARGFYEHATISLGRNNIVTITMQNEISMLDEKNGGRYTNEDQQDKFSGDIGFAFIADAVERKLSWGRRVIGGGGQPGNLADRERSDRNRNR